MKNNKSGIITFLLGCLGFSLLGSGIGGFEHSLRLGAESREIVYTLDASKAPTQSTTTVNQVEVKHDDYSTYRYTNVQYRENYFCILDAHGTIEKIEASYGIKSIKVDYETYNDSKGALFLQAKNEADDGYSFAYQMTSAHEYYVSGNYFKLSTTNGALIKSIQIKYDCITPVDRNTFNYRYVKDNAFVYETTNESMLDIEDNGTYNLRAMDTDQSHWGYKLGQSSYYDTPNDGNAFSPKTLKIGVANENGGDIFSSRLIFPFRLEAAATVQINFHLSHYYPININPGLTDKSQTNGEVISAWASCDGNYLKAPNQVLGRSSTSNYFNFINCNYGILPLEKGNHVVMMEFFTNATPNIDGLQLVVTDYDTDVVPVRTITDSGTTRIEVEELFPVSYGFKTFDPTWIGTKGRQLLSNDCTEGTSTISTAGVGAGSEYSVDINIPSTSPTVDVEINGYFAFGAVVDVHEAARLYIDGVIQDNSQFSQLSFDNTTGWVDFKKFNFGVYQLTSGQHRISFSNVTGYNIDRFELLVSNPLLTFNQNGDTTLQAEDEGINRSGWALRSDFIAAGITGYTENWSYSGSEISATSGTNLRGLAAGMEIEIPIKVQANCKLTVKLVIANGGVANCSEHFATTIDDNTLNDIDTTKTTGTHYFDWKIFNSGSLDLEAGFHIVKIKQINAGFNIDSFIFTISNYNA